MSGRNPDEIWDASVDEGERRVRRGTGALAATGFVGGADVMLGILAMTTVAGAVATVTTEAVAHVAGSLVFGIGFVFLIIGRAELFTENFLVPIASLLNGRIRASSVLRLWGMTTIGNLAGLALFAFLLSRDGLVPPDTLQAAGRMADTFAERDFVAALLSAIVAGATMTLFTWLAHALERDTGRIVVALLVGVVLALPSLNHAIVSFGEMGFGVLAGEGTATWGDVAQNFPVAVLGNLIGGLGLVTLSRLLMVRGEPDATGDKPGAAAVRERFNRDRDPDRQTV